MLGYLPKYLSRRAFIACCVLIVLVMGVISPMISPVVSSGFSALQCMSFGCTFKPTIVQEIAADRFVGSLRRGSILIRGLSQSTIFNAEYNYVGRLKKSAAPLAELVDSIPESHLPQETKDQLHSSATLAHSNLTSVRVHLGRLQVECAQALVAFISEFEALAKIQRSLSDRSSAKEWFDFQQQVAVAVYKLAARFGPLIYVGEDADGACGDAEQGFSSFEDGLSRARQTLKDWQKNDYSRLVYKIRCLIWTDCEHVKADLVSVEDGLTLVRSIKNDLAIFTNAMIRFVFFAGHVKNELDGYQGGPELEVAFRLVKFQEFVEMLTIVRRTIEGNMETSASA